MNVPRISLSVNVPKISLSVNVPRITELICTYNLILYYIDVYFYFYSWKKDKGKEKDTEKKQTHNTLPRYTYCIIITSLLPMDFTLTL